MSKDKVPKNDSILTKGWKDSWQWLLSTKLGWILAPVVGGVMGGIFLGNSLWQRAIAGLVGALAAVVLLFVIVFVIHLIISPSRIIKENRHKFIESSASYISKIIGSPIKKKYTEILDTLQAMITIENEVTDQKAGTYKLTDSEIATIQKGLSKITHIPTLPSSKAIKIYLAGNAHNKINQTMAKLKLNIIGNTPNENQIEFLIKARSVIDESIIGLADVLKNSNQYSELLDKFSTQIPEINNDTPDWVMLLLTVPSGINSVYLLWSALSPEYKKMFNKRNGTSPMPSDFKSERESGVKQLVEYAKDSIKRM
jgi:hypothetical protein